MLKFDPGDILSTKAAMETVLKAKAAGQIYVQKHLKGNFGDIDCKQKKANKENIASKSGKIISKYLLSNGSMLKIVTDFENKTTIFCVPDEDYSYLAKNKKFEESKEG